MFGRKNGRVYTTYSMPVSDWSNPPDDFLLNSYLLDSDAEFFATVGRIPLVCRPTEVRNQPEPLPRSQITAYLNSMEGIPKELVDQIKARGTALVPQLPMTNQEPIAKVREASQIQTQALLEYRLAVIRAGANPVPPIRKFLLKLWPDISNDLDGIETEEKAEL